MLYQGLFSLSFWQFVGLAFVLTHISIIAVTTYLHRSQAHRSVTFHPVVSHFFRFWVWFTTSMLTNEWVAVHRKHHAKVETEEDPHSPQQKGFWSILLLGVVHYRRCKADRETVKKYSTGTPDDWVERNVYQRSHYGGVFSLLTIDIVLFGFVVGFLLWFIQIMWVPFWAAGVVNGAGHFLGYRNYKTKDASTNISPIGFIIGGEELHNNHHAYPNSPKLSSKWYEIDMGWFYILLLEKVRLAKVNRSAIISKEL